MGTKFAASSASQKDPQTKTAQTQKPRARKSVKPTFLAEDNRLKTQVVGILNLTPDSFSDGGRYPCVDSALARADEMAADGADWIDVGGVSSRPGAARVTLEEELARVKPVLKKLCKRIKIPVSLDTSRFEVARAGLDLGVAMINDIRALQTDLRLARLVADSGAKVVLMHMQGEPHTMQKDPLYTDVVGEIMAFLRSRVDAVRAQGVRDSQIILDPGIGFGKTARHNLRILGRVADFCRLGFDVMIGPSRKAVIGEVLDLPVLERLHGTEALVALSIRAGARYVRVHDTREIVQVARMTDAVVHQ